MAQVKRTFKRYTLDEYVTQVLTPVTAKVRFSEIHVHGTWKPTIADFRKRPGEYYIQSMHRAHLQRNFGDIAQHATIDPDGYVWDGRPPAVAPCSATGHNDSDVDGAHPFMFEMIGNFDKGAEKLEGEQLATALELCRAVMRLAGRGPEIVRFHREYTDQKTCPGSGVDKAAFIKQLIEGDKPKMKREDAEKIIALLSASWKLTEDAEARMEIHRLADEVRKVAGIEIK